MRRGARVVLRRGLRRRLVRLLHRATDARAVARAKPGAVGQADGAVAVADGHALQLGADVLEDRVRCNGRRVL